jgi:DNA modification methylase
MSEPIETTRGIDTLSPHPRNYNQHPPAQIERLAASLRQFGQVRPIVVHGDTIIAGHGVYLAAQHLGYTSLRVTQLTHLPDDWTEEQAMAYLVADNETRRGAEPDDAELAALLDELRQQDFDIAAMGFDDAEYGALLDGLTPELPEPGNGGDEFEPDEAAPCRVQPGDVWLIGGVHRLICGDCTDPATVERLMQGERADAVVTDPPYSSGGFQEAGKSTGSIGNRSKETITNDNLSTRGYRLLIDEVLKNCIADVVYLFTDWRMWIETFDALERGGLRVRNMLVWDKIQMGMGFPWRNQHELIAFAKRTPAKMLDGKRGNVLQVARSGSEYHPTGKPVTLIEMLIDNTEAPLVLDPFLGSGTTIIAAHRTGRRCYGCEISPEYCEIILQRCEAEGLTVEKVEA